MSAAFPMGANMRAAIYREQRGEEMTPAQRRRYQKKSNGYQAKMERRGVKA